VRLSSEYITAFVEGVLIILSAYQERESLIAILKRILIIGAIIFRAKLIVPLEAFGG
jgi:hypothetical protein